MENFKQLGIYMDHTHAFLMELENGMIISRNILSGWKETDSIDKEDGHFIGFHSAEKKFLQAIYYKEISDIIRHYEQVVIFGPTDAKKELFNLLNDNYHFNKIKIDIVNTEKMTDAEMHKYMIAYYK